MEGRDKELVMELINRLENISNLLNQIKDATDLPAGVLENAVAEVGLLHKQLAILEYKASQSDTNVSEVRTEATQEEGHEPSTPVPYKTNNEDQDIQESNLFLEEQGSDEPEPAEDIPDASDLVEEKPVSMADLEADFKDLNIVKEEPNELLKSEEESVSEKLQNQPIGDLRSAMGINERFLYANALFQGDMDAFSQAIDELNYMQSSEDADKLMNLQLARKYRWNLEEEIVSDFQSLVMRRYL